MGHTKTRGPTSDHLKTSNEHLWVATISSTTASASTAPWEDVLFSPRGEVNLVEMTPNDLTGLSTGEKIYRRKRLRVLTGLSAHFCLWNVTGPPHNLQPICKLLWMMREHPWWEMGGNSKRPHGLTQNSFDKYVPSFQTAENKLIVTPTLSLQQFLIHAPLNTGQERLAGASHLHPLKNSAPRSCEQYTHFRQACVLANRKFQETVCKATALTSLYTL